MRADLQKILPIYTDLFFLRLIIVARCQFSQIHRNAVTDTRTWPRAGLDPKSTEINGNDPEEVHLGFTHLHAVLLNAAKNHRTVKISQAMGRDL